MATAKHAQNENTEYVWIFGNFLSFQLKHVNSHIK